MEFVSFTHYFCLIIIVVALESSGYKDNDVEENEVEEDKVKEGQEQETSVEQLKNKLPEKKTSDAVAYTPATFHWQAGIVPFVIGPEYDDIISERIRGAMRIIETSSCVVFKDMKRRPPPGQGSITWLSIVNPQGIRECSHITMRDEGDALVTKAIMIIGFDCMSRQDILHAMLHVLGFWDEVTHPQRDQYVRVMWENIQPKYRKLFWKQVGLPSHKFVEYDSMSIMHFHDRAYSMNGGATVMPVVSGLLISPSMTLSQIDVMKLRLAFGHECNNRKVGQLLLTCQNALTFDSEEQDIYEGIEGTKWCGTGNVASGPDDLGSKVEADKCCRAHDNCEDVIKAQDSRHNLTNTAFYARYYYNYKTGQCESFIYGGCQGNDNNFVTKKECCEACHCKC